MFSNRKEEETIDISLKYKITHKQQLQEVDTQTHEQDPQEMHNICFFLES